ncbi:DUF5602 domain-containing protein [Hymenobacter jeollabukensis]|uniref:TTHB210-like domain-containing protein n=1 Tax=Hymenobacter jeollabukensis TaxID=2025313 RepID=A0A5R8WRT0_9BACT|nr:DUF5602 domain-containing protein [Hymenobacter jeollabukensis]TLM93132.1 hypothetical protein FDY95_10905 [Hymenobacter jeollabukensis]
MKKIITPVSPASLRLATLALVGLGLLTGCDDDDNNTTSQPATTYGAAVTVGGGSARAYVTTDASGQAAEVGIRLTEAGLTGLPATPVTGTMYDLPLPAAATQTPFDHVSFDWNPQGHEPAGVYTTPHFDAHFYMQSMSAQHSITLDDPRGDIFPATTMLPAGYITPPNNAPGRTVPMMGRHWVDPTSPEYQPGGSFSSTFIYGTYDGHVTFLEPMFTKALLTTSVNFAAPVKQPQTYEAAGKYYPTQYRIRYDAATREYVIALTDLVKR